MTAYAHDIIPQLTPLGLSAAAFVEAAP